jgi:hypothetical protein
LLIVVVMGAVLVYLWFAGYLQKPSQLNDRLRKAEDRSRISPAGTGGSGTAVLRLYVCNVDRAAVDVVDVYAYRPGSIKLQGPASTFHIVRRACAVHPPPGCGIYPGYDYDEAHHAEGHRLHSRRRGILEGYGTSPPDPPITPNLLSGVGV